MLNAVCLMGRLAADPELKHTQNQIPVTSFRIAVDRTYQPKGQEKQTDWIDIVAWRNTAEFVTRYFHKGSMIAVQGSIQTRSYTDRDGNKRTAFEVVADNVFFGAPAASTPAAGTHAAGTRPAEAKTPDDFEEIVGDDMLPF